MKAAEQLFAVMESTGASMLTILPRDAAGETLGVVVVVSAEHTTEFLQFLEQYQRPSVPAAKVEHYDIWDDGE